MTFAKAVFRKILVAKDNSQQICNKYFILLKFRQKDSCAFATFYKNTEAPGLEPSILLQL